MIPWTQNADCEHIQPENHKCSQIILPEMILGFPFK